MDKFNNLQGLRALGFIFIFLNHCFWLISKTKPFDFGARGVEIFFVLSGFLIAYHYSDKNLPSSWKDSWTFMMQKLKKFYVLHMITFIVMLVYFLNKFFTKGVIQYGDWQTFTFNAFLNITLLKAWYRPSAFSFNGVTWFLSAILFMYFLTPKTINFFKGRKYSENVIIFFCLLTLKFVLDTFTYKIIHTPFFFSWYQDPAYRFLDFLLGYASCLVLYKTDFTSPLYPSKKIVSALQLISLLVYLYACYLFNKLWLPAPFILLTLLVIYSCTFKTGILNGLLGNPIAVHLGNISFELYIVHQVVINLCAGRIVKYIGPMSTMAICFIVSILFAEFFHWDKIRKYIIIK